MLRTCRVSVVFVAFTFFSLTTGAGCVKVKQIPVDLETCKVDEKLTGSWTADKKTRESLGIEDYVKVERYSPKGRTDLPKGIMRLASRTGGSDRETNVRYFFVARIGEENYVLMLMPDTANMVQTKWDKSKLTGCWLWRYRLDEDRIEIRESDQDVAVDELKRRLLTGTYREGASNDAEVDQLPEMLIMYLTKGGGQQRLFPDSKRKHFERLK